MKRMRMLSVLSRLVALAACVGLWPGATQIVAAQSAARTASVIAKETPSVTWSHDIAPLVYSHCTTCHHPGGAGPFSLLSYTDARRWARQMLLVTQSHFMPPWLPEPGYGDFADVRRLGDRDVQLIKTWVQAGLPQGNPSEEPVPPHYDAVWQLGKPDLILKVERPFTLVASGSDVFRNFILPYPLKQTHYIRAMEILPAVPQIVHHANVIIDRTASLRGQHPDDWQDGVPGMELLVDSGNRFDPDSHFLFWKPDTPALIEPKGMPWRLDPGNDLILNMHLKPSGKPEMVDAQVGLYFTDEPPTVQPMLLQLDRDDALDIPPGNPNFVVEDTLTLPVDVEVLGVYPHAHYLGKDLEGWAVLPSGAKKWFVWIRSWDIDRQSVYRYKQPMQLPAGTVLHMRYTYDNSLANVHNPSSPPVRVHAGNRSIDEMSHLWLQVLPAHTPPNSPDPRLLLQEAWMRNRLRKSPHDRVSLYNLGAALAGEGKFTQAAEIYQRELALDPNDVRALTALGAALEGAGQSREAEERFRDAISNAKIGSTACDARFNLANLELRLQELKNAESDFRADLESCGEDAEVHAGLGSVFGTEGQTDTAVAEFHRSLELDPGNEVALLGLGEAEVNAGDSAAAILHLTEVVGLDPSSADAHEQLARAYAQSGNADGTKAELEKAAQLRPDDPLIHSALSQVLASTGNLQQAIAEQRVALRLLEDDPDGWNNLGVLEARSGDTNAARDAFEHALHLQPDHAQAKANLDRILSRQ